MSNPKGLVVLQKLGLLPSFIWLVGRLNKMLRWRPSNLNNRG
jgi:hypothetical protein